jgi:hypothetical protein
MTGLLRFIDRVFDLAFRLMRTFPPLVVLAVFSILATVFALLVFRWISNQKAIRRAKDRIGAHVLEIRLFPDQLSVVAHAYLAFLGSLVVYLRHVLRPVLVLFVPLFLLFVQMDAYFAYAPLKTSQDFLVRAVLADGQHLNELGMRLPAGIAMTAPPVHIPPDREVDWRLQADAPGTYEVQLNLQGTDFSKRLVVGAGLKRVNWERERAGLWEALLSQDEPPLPKNGPIESIQVQYPERQIPVWRWELNWLVPFLVFMLIGALALKGALRTEL